MTSGLTAKIIGLHEALESAGLTHAFGGALALAYCTAEPRATSDIDLNIFCSPDEVELLRRSLPAPITVDDRDRVAFERDGQARLWWEATPVDVFLPTHSFHHQAAANRRFVPFAGIEIPVLACSDLAVFKTFFARPKDALDIATMVSTGSIDLTQLTEAVAALLGGDDRATFLAKVSGLVAELDGT
ncbi:MAG: hypothetical protein JST73_00665 [Actinobacteria bacterium]|nr:hypothetical protein [Actinomycetota bacterium]